jgi:cytochrome c-type biogenesis protein CcmH
MRLPTGDTPIPIPIPAKAGTHCSDARMVDRWVPALAGIRAWRRWHIVDILRCFLGLLLFVIASSPAHAVRPDEKLPDPALEARARAVGEQLRCLVCRNQSIEDSDADLARDLRVLVRQRVTAGESDAQIVAYIRSRYGDFVLLRPPVTMGTLLLWVGPLLILLLGGVAVARFYRGRHTEPAPPPLSADEQRRLTAVLADGHKP